ncbi:uncharacterized protein LOC144434971 [Glandiceps talaboti]
MIDSVQISDHFPVHARIVFQKPPLLRRQIVYRHLKSLPVLNEFIEDLKLMPDLSIQQTDVETVVMTFNSYLSNLLDKYAPLKSRTIVIRPNTKWYTTDINDAKKQRRHAEQKWRKTKLEVHHQIYIEESRKVGQLIRQSKKLYYTSLVEDNSNDQKALFKIFSTLSGSSKHNSSLPSHDSPQELAEQFSAYFIDKIADMRRNLNSFDFGETQATFNITTNATSTFNEFQLFSPDHVHKIITKSLSKSCSIDPIPTSLFKKCITELVPILTEIINSSLQQGIVPDSFKSAVVTPLLKKSSLDCINLKNYGPVSNLPFFSKILEKVVATQLNAYLSDNVLCEQFQSAL